ncbi:MAG: hypothetical protein LBK99_03605 [Opitutaceae bacterium]|jgi:hypothetical protein|nr:hypothetical protein [Opitutaceae bacterium]
MKNHTGLMKNHLLHTRRRGSLWRTLPALALAALFATSTGFAQSTRTYSVKSGVWSDSSVWESVDAEMISSRSVSDGHTVTIEGDQSVQVSTFFSIYGHMNMEAGSSFFWTGGIFTLASLPNDDGDWSLARMTLGSGATADLSGGLVALFGTVEMAAGSHLSLASGGLGWQNLVFDGNGQDSANAWISTPVLLMATLNEWDVASGSSNARPDMPAEVGPWYNIELNGFGEGTWSLISGISTLVDIATVIEEGEDAMETINLSALEKITLSGDSVANARAELGMVFDEGTDTYTLTVTITAVPEPAAYATLAGLTLLAWVAMRRSRGAHGACG